MTKSECSNVALTDEDLLSLDLPANWQLLKAAPSKLVYEAKFADFAQALDFVNKVGAVAEELNHHPDIVLKWGYVRIELWTHNASGLTAMDFKMAARVSEL
jgi:4a-hydroxytetrahydrobiopterin dehydratase